MDNLKYRKDDIVMKTKDRWVLTVAIGSVVYLIILMIWRKLNPDSVLFYQGTLLALVLSVVQFVLQKHTTDSNEAAKNAVVTFLLCYCFMFTVPTTVDRSYSVNLLLELENHPEGRSRSQINQFYVEYFVSRGGVEKRLNEQLATGTITEHSDQYQLTTFGYFLTSAFNGVRRLFSIPTRVFDGSNAK